LYASVVTYYKAPSQLPGAARKENREAYLSNLRPHAAIHNAKRGIPKHGPHQPPSTRQPCSTEAQHGNGIQPERLRGRSVEIGARQHRQASSRDDNRADARADDGKAATRLAQREEAVPGERLKGAAADGRGGGGKSFGGGSSGRSIAAAGEEECEWGCGLAGCGAGGEAAAAGPLVLAAREDYILSGPAAEALRGSAGGHVRGYETWEAAGLVESPAGAESQAG
jgi:hypothetical protein